MHLANIVPGQLLEAVLGDDDNERYHLVLAHLLLEDPAYLTFYQERVERGDFVIVDNGAHENDVSQTPEYLARAVHRLCRTFAPKHVANVEIVLPDVARGRDKAKRTVRNSQEGAQYLRNTFGKQVRLMAVPHGESLPEYLACAQLLSVIPGVTAFGVSDDECLDVAYGDREYVARQLKAEHPHLDLHYLGMLETLHDLGTPWARENVRGVDGCKFVRWGMDGVFVKPEEPVPPYPGRGAGYFTTDLEDVEDNLQEIRDNIEVWRHVVTKGLQVPT